MWGRFPPRRSVPPHDRPAYQHRRSRSAEPDPHVAYGARRPAGAAAVLDVAGSAPTLPAICSTRAPGTPRMDETASGMLTRSACKEPGSAFGAYDCRGSSRTRRDARMSRSRGQRRTTTSRAAAVTLLESVPRGKSPARRGSRHVLDCHADSGSVGISAYAGNGPCGPGLASCRMTCRKSSRSRPRGSSGSRGVSMINTC